MYENTPFRVADEILALPWVKNPAPLRDREGVYMIREKGTDVLLYIGQSVNVGMRLCPSVHPVYDRDRHDVYVLFTDGKQERRYMEERCIAILKPPVNIRAGLRPVMTDELKRAYYDIVFR